MTLRTRPTRNPPHHQAFAACCETCTSNLARTIHRHKRTLLFATNILIFKELHDRERPLGICSSLERSRRAAKSDDDRFASNPARNPCQSLSLSASHGRPSDVDEQDVILMSDVRRLGHHAIHC
jgi:hypothetical protein